MFATNIVAVVVGLPRLVKRCYDVLSRIYSAFIDVNMRNIELITLKVWV